MRSLQNEVKHVSDSFKGGKACPLCPWRSFARSSRTIDHLRKYHAAEFRYCTGSSKQFRLALALWDYDCLSKGECADSGDYLRRSVALMRKSVQPPLKSTLMGARADKYIGLVLTKDGPLYYNRQNTDNCRRVGNFYYDHSFATNLLHHCLLAKGSIRGTISAITKDLSAQGCETSRLLPVCVPQWARFERDQKRD